ncbi:kinase-like protein, partial [Rhizoclosmatium globosum]
HENIVRFFGCHKSEKHVWMVLEYLNRGSVARHIKSYGRIAESSAAFILKSITQALHYLHFNGIVHGDVKGDNILLGSKGEIKLADFGLSFCGVSNTRAGTYLWMAPEIVKKEQFGTSSDVWSLGICAIECLDGEPPFSHESPTNIIKSIKTNRKRQAQRKVSCKCQEFLDCCLETLPSARSSSETLLNVIVFVSFYKLTEIISL